MTQAVVMMQLMVIACILFEQLLDKRGADYVIRVFRFLGEKSLEIFVGHSIGRYIISNLMPDSEPRLFYYIVFTIVLSIVVDRMNYCVQLALKRI
jgi:peptidoglycan/LPS O-acetylase OafA/YrhL